MNEIFELVDDLILKAKVEDLKNNPEPRVGVSFMEFHLGLLRGLLLEQQIKYEDQIRHLEGSSAGIGADNSVNRDDERIK